MENVLNNPKPTNFATFSTLDEDDSGTKSEVEVSSSVDGVSGIHWLLGSFIFINTLVGAGILNFPYSLHLAGGIVPAMVIQLLMVVLIWASISGMVWASHLKGTSFYQDTVYVYLGAGGRFLCTCLMLCHCYLICTVYLIAIGDQLSAGLKLALSATALDHWYLSRNFLVVATSVFIFPWCLVKSIDKLHGASAIASATVALVAGIVAYEYFHLEHDNVHMKTAPDHWSDLLLSVPAYAVAYMFDLCSVAVYGRLKKRSIGSFMKASSVALASVFVFYNVFAGFAYATFGDTIKPNFMVNYAQHERKGSWIIMIAEVTYSLKLCLEYPIYQFLGWTALHSLVDSCSGGGDETTGSRERHGGADRWWTSLLWLCSTISIAIFARSISTIIPLVGVDVLHFQFTFPGLVVYLAIGQCLKEGTVSYVRYVIVKIFSSFIILLGCCLSAILLFQYVYSK